MALRRLVAMVIFWPPLIASEAPHPCFASEAIPLNERRFFTFAPANVRSDPPVDCVFVFGGPPGSLLRLGLYDVRTKGPQASLGQESARLCGSDVIRVYDAGHQGLQLRAAYCGLLQRGKMLSMSSNMAVVTYTSDSNDPGNAFNLGVDAVDTRRETVRRETADPCQGPSASTAAPGATAPATTAERSASDPEGAATATRVRSEDQYGDWGSGDSGESGERDAAWYHGNGGAVVTVISTGGGGRSTPPASEGGARRVGAAAVARSEQSEAAPSGAWEMPEAEVLEGEDTGKVVTVYSNGTGDEDEDALAFYYYL